MIPSDIAHAGPDFVLERATVRGGDGFVPECASDTISPRAPVFLNTHFRSMRILV